MNRNVESRFSYLPAIKRNRSRIPMNSRYLSTWNIGECIPVFHREVLPGDTWDVKSNKVVRLQTLLTPIFDNVYMDVMYFFVPNRLVWSHWKEFMGENSTGPWTPTVQYTIPQLVSPSNGFNVGTLADYFGMRTGIAGLEVSALPFRGYSLIMNEFFRDENLQTPLNVNVDDTTVTGSNGSNYVTDCVLGGKPFIACKYHDQFTSALPEPQKGPAVPIPIAMGSSASLPVFAGNTLHDSSKLTKGIVYYGDLISSSTYQGVNYRPINAGSSYLALSSPVTSAPDVGYHMQTQSPANLYADAAGLNIQAGTINELRTAFALQKMYELDARGGSRYIEILRSHFSTISPDYRLQRPEYLGGSRIPLNINSVVQQSGTFTQSGVTNTPQGTLTAYSVTADSHKDFVKSFTEHGQIFGIAVLRYKNSYSQGTPEYFFRKNRIDFYDPIFANLGEQPIKNRIIYTQGPSVINPVTGRAYDDEVFGYQEAWYSYRYSPDMITGEMRSDYATSLDKWHLGDDYSSMPTLGSSWIQTDKSNVDRVLAVTSSVANQVLGDFYFDCKVTRVMPLNSIPGLIDHM